MGLRFPDRPATTLPELQRNVIELFYQLGAGAEGRLHRDVEVSSAGTAFAHGLRGVPQSALIVPKEITDGPPYVDPDRPATSELLYFKAVPLTIIGPFVGGLGAGARTFARSDVGDVVDLVINMNNGADQSADFESIITVDNQIQQLSGLLAVAMLAVLKRPVVVNCDLVVIP